MGRYKNLAKIIRMLGGIEALERRELYVENGDAYLTMTLLGVGPSGGDSRILEVEVVEFRAPRSSIFRTVSFEVLATADRRVGWQSGRWIPLSYRIRRRAHDAPHRIRAYHPVISPDHLRSLAYGWDDWVEEFGFVDEAEYAAALIDFDRRWNARRERRQQQREQADRDRAAAEAERARARESSALLGRTG